MKKEIKMDYAEYEQMVSLIKEQQKVIEEFKKESKVVLIEDREYFRTRYDVPFTYNRVPKIVTTDETLAKEYLKEKFDDLSKQFINLEKIISDPEKYLSNPIKEDKPQERKKSSWLSFLTK
jgi:predicted transcriptional regulator